MQIMHHWSESHSDVEEAFMEGKIRTLLASGKIKKCGCRVLEVKVMPDRIANVLNVLVCCQCSTYFYPMYHWSYRD